MATVTYTFVSRCTGGDHVTMDVQVNAGATERLTYDIDDIRMPLSQLTEEQISIAKAFLLRIHVAGKTRAQLVTEFASPVVITI